jgi:uncharacterized membrane protein YbhN (UPF0104 family)
MSKLKRFFRWFVLGFTLFFVVNTFQKYWLEVIAVRIDFSGWFWLAIALLVTMIAHLWSAFVWTWIINYFQITINLKEAITIYLKTNLAKYLPGNVWHFYGRIMAIKQAGGSLEIASFTVILEPILMAVAAGAIALIGGNFNSNKYYFILQIIGLILVLIIIHPRIINKIIKFLNRLKTEEKQANNVGISTYPWLALLGEFIFLLARGTGFLITLSALIPLNPEQIFPLFTAFSFAWLLGLIVPGAPGGLGVFEVTMMTVLDNELSGQVVVAIALFRLVSISAEVLTATLVSLPAKTKPLEK